jgi:hypothetical protein
VQLALRDRQQAVGAERDAFVELQLLLQPLAPEPEGAARAGREVLFEIREVARDRARRLGRGVIEIHQHEGIVERAEGAGQILLDEAERAAQALEADLHEHAGRLLDVVARGLDQARDLVELRHDAARALGERRVVEEDLAGEARAQQIAVVLGIALPGPHGFELEEARADVGVQRRPLEPFDVGQARRIDRIERRANAPRSRIWASTAARLRSSSRSSWKMDAVKRCVRRVRFVEHARYSSTKCGKGSAEYILVESAPRAWPASCTWSARPSVTSRM